MPAVSVIIPVYKVEEYIERCARNLLGQTLQDMEFIFVDDCTPDSSMEILMQVLEDYPERRHQVKIVKNEVNKGLPFTRSVGVKIATGDYLIHCDSDDWPRPDMYEKMYAKAVSEDLDIVICGILREYPDGSTKPVRGITSTDDLLESLLYQDVLHYVHNKLVRRRIYDNDLVIPAYNMLEDSPLIIQLVYYCNSWGFIEENLYNYTYRPESISAAWDSMAKVEQIRANVNLLLSFLDSKGLSGKYSKAITHLKSWVKFSALQLPRRYYLNLYPEANVPLFFDKRFTVMERLGHLSKILGTHGISRPFVKKKK